MHACLPPPPSSSLLCCMQYSAWRFFDILPHASLSPSLSLSILFGTFDSIDGAAAAAGKANILLNKLNAVVVARGRQEKGRGRARQKLSFEQTISSCNSNNKLMCGKKLLLKPLNMQRSRTYCVSGKIHLAPSLPPPLSLPPLCALFVTPTRAHIVVRGHSVLSWSDFLLLCRPYVRSYFTAATDERITRQCEIGQATFDSDCDSECCSYYA